MRVFDLFSGIEGRAVFCASKRVRPMYRIEARHTAFKLRFERAILRSIGS